ncbi:hypothetical protein [Bradyrhizobium erythrophlei]|jgi:hypothetical protein|uniref:Uncharacterized protein n=1 Tax=Bradyrhizobium erythrophlei TaxID=1437360 RepID=A0A1M7UFI6_9BRAD|nr:hypothetical protein [Bradyrhizobium erythrophlei]SHN81655.1 hypothetical protein SAMN05444170_4834 [Bradyrhizobium erythrophlei]
MIFFAKLLFGSLRGIDPLILLALICLGLSACFMALFVELEKVRTRWRDNAMKRRSQAPASPVVSELRRRDRQN